MFKFAGFLTCGALLLLTGCSTPGDHEPPPREWSLPNLAPAPGVTNHSKPTNAPIKVVVAPATRSNVPPQKISAPAPAALTWTSLNQWAAENKLAPPRRVTESPVASYAITSPTGTMIFEIGSREASWRGIEIHLGFPPEIIDNQVFIHGLDLRKNLEPLLTGKPFTFGTNRVLVLDPGHGGSNTGTHNLTDGRFEKEFTLDWAFRIQSLLATNGWTVFLTRTNDMYVTNSTRPLFANAHRADVFISLHFNSAAPDTTQSGIEIYCLTPTGMPSTLTRGYNDFWTDHYLNNAYDAENLQLAVRLQTALLHGSGEEDRGIRRARFMDVLHDANCPAILIEGGFLSNPQEAKKIEDPRFRQKLAEAVAGALK